MWNHPPTEIQKCSWITSFPAQPGPVEIREGQPHENKRWLCTQSLLQTGSQPQSLCFGKVSGRADQGVGERPSGEKERFQGGLIGVPLACGS